MRPKLKITLVSLAAAAAGWIAGCFFGFLVFINAPRPGDEIHILFWGIIGSLVALGVYASKKLNCESKHIIKKQPSSERAKDDSRTQNSPMNKWFLRAIVAFFAGLLLGLIGGLVTINTLKVHPLDRSATVEALTVLGIIAGTVVCFGLLIVGVFSLGSRDE